MKKLKLLLLTLLSVLSFNLFSQIQVNTTSTSGPNVCDGMAALDSSNVATISNIVWQGMGAILQQGNYMIDSLCPGTYGVTFVTNNTPVTLTFTIQAGTFNPCLNFSGIVLTSNSLDSLSCNGVMGITLTNGTAPFSYQWSNGQTTQTMNSLCPGSYCCYVTDMNGCTLTLCDTVGIQSSNVGDTLVITNTGSCNNPINTLTTTIEDCNINYATVDTVYMNVLSYPVSPFDITSCVWYVVDTTGSYTTYNVFYITNDSTGYSTGCYNFQLTLYCYNKSMNYNTIVASQTESMGFVGINELSGNSKQLIRVSDLMGREVKEQSNKFLIYTYSDGSKEIKYINE